jgi:hypothetical protein
MDISFLDTDDAEIMRIPENQVIRMLDFRRTGYQLRK